MDLDLVHLVADFAGLDAGLLDDPAALGGALEASLQEAGYVPLERCWHKFEPRGASVAVIIAESHATIHTWPELGLAAVDLFSCAGPGRAEVALDALRRRLAPSRFAVRTLRRGLLLDGEAAGPDAAVNGLA